MFLKWYDVQVGVCMPDDLVAILILRFSLFLVYVTDNKKYAWYKKMPSSKCLLHERVTISLLEQGSSTDVIEEMWSLTQQWRFF